MTWILTLPPAECAAWNRAWSMIGKTLPLGYDPLRWVLDLHQRARLSNPIVIMLPSVGPNANHLFKGGQNLQTLFKLAGGSLAVSGCLFLFVSTPAAAYFDTGNELYETCIAPDKSSKRLICLATASAYLDMMRSLGYACTDDKLSRRQVADVVVKFLKENPESRQKPGPSLAVEAFSKGFGCKKQ